MIDLHFLSQNDEILKYCDVKYIILIHSNIIYVKALKMKLSGLTQCGEAAAVWLRHVCLDQCFVGYVEARRGNEVDITLFDTTMKDLDIVINDEMIKLGFATKEVSV